jgi:hypothetical protein
VSKYKENSYLIVLFDEYGTKKDTRVSTEPGLLGSQHLGYKIMEDEGFASFAVTRVLFNTIDAGKRDKWK